MIHLQIELCSHEGKKYRGYNIRNTSPGNPFANELLEIQNKVWYYNTQFRISQLRRNHHANHHAKHQEAYTKID